MDDKQFMSKKIPLESKELELMGLRKNEEDYYVFLSIKSEFKNMKKQKKEEKKKNERKWGALVYDRGHK